MKRVLYNTPQRRIARQIWDLKRKKAEAFKKLDLNKWLKLSREIRELEQKLEWSLLQTGRV